VCRRFPIEQFIAEASVEAFAVAIFHGEPGSMKAAFKPTVAIQFLTFSATNSGPLSDLIVIVRGKFPNTCEVRRTARFDPEKSKKIIGDKIRFWRSCQVIDFALTLPVGGYLHLRPHFSP
jgi:hypothetical protein